MTTKPQDLDALVYRGENPPFGTETSERNLMSEMARAITTLRRDLLAAEAAGRAEYARGLRDALEALRGAGTFGKTARDQHIALEQYCMDRDAILALLTQEGR